MWSQLQKQTGCRSRLGLSLICWGHSAMLEKGVPFSSAKKEISVKTSSNQMIKVRREFVYGTKEER